MTLQVRFLGSGDAFGSGGRFQTCIQVFDETTCVLMDCGPSTLISMQTYGVDPNDVDAIALTHLHGDHFGGVQFFILHAQFAAHRTAPLIITGPPGTRRRVLDAMEILFHGSADWPRAFDIDFVEIGPKKRVAFDDFAVTGIPVAHPSGAPSYGLRLDLAGRTVAYTGDTQWCDAVLDIARDADLFIAECYTFDEEVPYHTNYRILDAHGDDLQPKNMILTHMSPSMLHNADANRWPRAEDGLVVDID